MDLSVAVIATRVGKTPEQIPYSFVFNEIYRLAKRGIRVYAIRFAVELPSESYKIHFYGLERLLDLKAMTTTVKNLGYYPLVSLFRSPKRIYGENLYAINIARVVEKHEIDLMHAHFAHYGGLAGLLAKKKCKKPLIVTLHGFDILIEPSINYGIRLSRRYDAIVRKVLLEADAIIAASSATYREALKIIGKDEKVHFIPNGVDLRRFNPDLDGTSIKKRLKVEDKYVVFTVRKHKPKYGIMYLIIAAALVLKKRSDVVFIIGGDGPLRKFHEELAVRLGIRDKIIFTGRISQKDLPYYYAASDVVVVPSVQEAFGLVVSEAMACGRPVIGSRVGGILDQIIDGVNGFLVAPKKPEQIAEKIVYLIDNSSEARRMGMNGRRIAEEKFDIEKRIDQIIRLYKKIYKKFRRL